MCLRKMRATTTLIEDPALLECVPTTICGPHWPDGVGGARVLDGPTVFPRSSNLAPKLGEMGLLSTQQPMGQTCAASSLDGDGSVRGPTSDGPMTGGVLLFDPVHCSRECRP